MIQLLIPYHFIVAKAWQTLQLPLWNPFCGFGAPLVGDIQAGILSPLRLLFFLHPTMYTYNLTLVIEVILAALGTFFLARTLGLSRSSGIFASIVFSLCPFNLYYLELFSGSGYSILPWLFFSFTRLAQHPSVGRAAMAGTICAIMILSSHPETCFFNIFFATIITMALQLSDRQSGRSFSAQFLLFLRNLTVAATCAFCLSAPVLLPFFEYLLNSNSYKFTIGGSSWIPWQAITYNFLQPGFGPVSPFLTIVTTVTFPLALVSKGKNRSWVPALMLVALFAFMITARIGIFDALFLTRPFNCLITAYCLPVLLLLITILSASGFEELIENARTKSQMCLLIASLGTTCVIFIPWLLHVFKVSLSVGDFDMMVPHMAVNLHSWKQQTVLALLLFSVIALSKYLPRTTKWIFPIALIVISFISQGLVAKASLPTQNHFNYPVVEPIPFLQQSHEKIVCLGDHLFRPNTSGVYGITDIRSHNPLFPQRYLDFLKKCGAKLDMFNQTFHSAASNLLDMASVKYVLSLDPLTPDKGFLANNSEKPHLVTITPQGIHVYERRSCLPQAFLVHGATLVHTKEEALEHISAPEFNPRHNAVIELPPNIDSHNFPSDGIAINGLNSDANFSYGQNKLTGNDMISLTRPNANKVTIQIESDKPGILVLTDTYYPGWRANLDGHEVPVLRANFLFRGIKVPAGRHRLTFEYEPFSFRLGVYLAFGCMSLMLLFLIAQLIGRPKAALSVSRQNSRLQRKS